MGFPIKFGPKTGSNSSRELVSMLKNQSKFLNCDGKKKLFYKGVIFETNSRIMVFTFVKREFKDFAFHKCEVSVSGKKRKVLRKSKKQRSKVVCAKCELRYLAFLECEVLNLKKRQSS